MSCGSYPVSRDSPPIISLTMGVVGQAKYVVQNVVFLHHDRHVHAFGGACHIGHADMQASLSRSDEHGSTVNIACAMRTLLDRTSWPRSGPCSAHRHPVDSLSESLPSSG